MTVPRIDRSDEDRQNEWLTISCLREMGWTWKNIAAAVGRPSEAAAVSAYRNWIRRRTNLRRNAIRWFIEEVATIESRSPSDNAIATERWEVISDVLSTLTYREEMVLWLRFGLADGYPRLLGEVGSVFNITRGRVRQIEAKALRKLHHPLRRRILKQRLGLGANETETSEEWHEDR